jgi:hypothetical protein
MDIKDFMNGVGKSMFFTGQILKWPFINTRYYVIISS